MTSVMGGYANTSCAQEDGRFDTSTLALTRGNRSVRFFGYLVDELSAGRQPDPGQVGDAGYIMRSTAFYGNGKYGMRSFEAFPDDHPLAAPYRAQFLAAWCYRELSIDVVEHCARLRGGESAATSDPEWGRFFGLGNATGLGLVPYAFKHPQIINAWVGVRELALARVRNLEATDARWDALIAWLQRAEAHYLSRTSESADPFLSPAELVPLVRKVRARVEELATGDRHARFDDLMTWAMTHEIELAELVVAAMVGLQRQHRGTSTPPSVPMARWFSRHGDRYCGDDAWIGSGTLTVARGSNAGRVRGGLPGVPRSRGALVRLRPTLRRASGPSLR